MKPDGAARHRAREAALQMLYQWEVGRVSPQEAVLTYWPGRDAPPSEDDEHADAVPFERFDRFAQARDSAGKSLPQLLEEFAALRKTNLHTLASFGIGEVQLDRSGRHPELGGVTLRQLLATWVAHDLDHVVQIARVMASQYADEVGPWKAYLRVISGRQG